MSGCDCDTECNDCGEMWRDVGETECPFCGSTNVNPIYGNDEMEDPDEQG